MAASSRFLESSSHGAAAFTRPEVFLFSAILPTNSATIGSATKSSILFLHRFYTDSIPRWLDEGVAQFISKDAHASYERARGYIAKPHSEAIAPQDFIPVPALVTMNYPLRRIGSKHFMTNRSVWFVFSPRRTSRRFWRLLDALARHQPFETVLAAFLRLGNSPSMAALDEQFREYAAKDFGSFSATGEQQLASTYGSGERTLASLLLSAAEPQRVSWRKRSH